MSKINELLKVESFSYEIVHIPTNTRERVEGAILVIPNGWKWDDGFYTNMVVRAHGTDEKEIEFKSVDDAQRYLDEYRNSLEFEWRNRDELHALIRRTDNARYGA